MTLKCAGEMTAKLVIIVGTKHYHLKATAESSPETYEVHRILRA